MLRRITIFIATATVIVGTVYLAFVSDVGTPRSSSTMRGIFETHNSIPPMAFKAISAASKSKFGEAAEIERVSTGIEVKVSGKVVATEPVPFRFYEAFGATEIVEPSGARTVFPFYVSPYEMRPEPYPDLVRRVDHFLGQFFPPDDLDLDENEFSIEPCQSIPAKEFGIALRLLNIGDSIVCGVVSKREPSRRALVGVVSADGGRWIRPFVRGACRMLSGTWLARDRQLNEGRQPNYLQCMIADRPENEPNGSGVSALVYEVRSDNTLARMEGEPKALSLYPLKPDPRIPTFNKAATEPVAAPPVAAEPVGDPMRELRTALSEAANKLKDEPCDNDNRTRYIEAAVNYINAWLKIIPCYKNNKCSGQWDRIEKIEEAIGRPGRRDLSEAMSEVHQKIRFQESDFPGDTLLMLASLASDPTLNPGAKAETKETHRSMFDDVCTRPARN